MVAALPKSGVASVRLSLADVATRSELADHLDRLSEAIDRMSERLGELELRAAKGEPLDQPRPDDLA